MIFPIKVDEKVFEKWYKVWKSGEITALKGCDSMIFPIIRREPTTTCYFCGTNVSVKYLAETEFNGEKCKVPCCDGCALQFILNKDWKGK